MLNKSHFCKDWHFLSKFTQFWSKLTKFGQKICDLFKITFCVITWARMKLETWNLVSVCRKKLQKTYKERNFEFLIFSLFIVILVIFLLKKQTKFNRIKKKSKIQSSASYKFFVIFLPIFTKFHVFTLILAPLVLVLDSNFE